MVSNRFCRLALSIVIIVTFIAGAIGLARDLSQKVADQKVQRNPLAATLSADSIFDPGIEWPTRCGCQQTGKINATFTCYGLLGREYTHPSDYGWPDVNFEVPANSNIEYLWIGAIWVGGIVDGDTLVSTGHDGWTYSHRELWPPDGRLASSITKFDYPTDYSMRAIFTDTTTEGIDPDESGVPYRPLGLRIANRSHVRRSDPYRDVVLYDLVITNIGEQNIEKGYLGMYFDPDVYLRSDQSGYSDDLAGSLRSSGIAYGVDNNGDPVDGVYEEETSTTHAFAFTFLETSFEALDTNFNWWVANSAPVYDFGPRRRGTPEAPVRYFDSTGTATGYPVGNANKYYIMSFPEWDYDQCQVASILPIDTAWLYPESRTLAFDLCDGYDTRFLMSIGPFDLPPDSSIRVQLTTFTADSIHTNPNIMQYLPYYPSAYTAMLGVERLESVAEVARQFGRELLDPSLPPIGFEAQYSSPDSIVYEWDPWVFGDVTGYRLMVGKASPADLPHPGVIPPWQLDIPLDTTIDIGRTYRYNLTEIDPSLIYVARLCHILEGGAGDLSQPASVHVGEPPPPPTMAQYSFAVEGEPIELRWSPPEGVYVDHFNIYKFEDSAAAAGRYLPFYDTRSEVGDLTPRETVTVEGSTYYYYALEPYATAEGGDSTLPDIADEGNRYVVTSVDAYGFESDMSAISSVYVMPQRNRDVLVLTHSSGSKPIIVSYNSIQAFYDSVFAGTGLNYEIMDIRNVCISIRTCPDWRLFLPFRWVIVDDIIYDALPYREYETEMKGFTRYVLSNGNLAYFGGGFETWSWLSLRTPPIVVGIDNAAFIKRFFGIDSLSFVGSTYEYPNPINDSLFGFSEADATANLPSLRSRPDAYPLGEHWDLYWPLESPPSVTTYTPNDRASVTHTYRSLYPSTSLFEGGAVGLKTATETCDTYLFGFHLYYMRVLDARGLLGSMITGNRPPVLSVTGEDNFETDGVYPDTGGSGTVFTFRVRYDDPEGCSPMAGYPRVYLKSTKDPSTESQYVMHVDGDSPATSGVVYAIDVSGLIPGSYTYRFEARDTGAALAGGEASMEMTGPFVHGDVWHVTVNGNDESGDGSESAPYGTVQYAINAGLDGDAVVVHDGTYSGEGNRDIRFGGKDLIVRSQHGPWMTVIDAQGAEDELHRAFDFSAGGGNAVVVEGFTIRGGYADTGGGVIINDCSPAFRYCVFTGNVASAGPAVAVYGGTPTFEHCTIAENVGDNGGAMELFAGSLPTEPALDKCIVAFNSGVASVICDGEFTGIAVSDCDIFQNELGDWVGCIAGMEGLDGNFSDDPGFCDASLPDYSLRAGSPCLPDENAGHELIGALAMGCVPTSVDGQDLDEGIPKVFSLSQNYPNPFNSETVITFGLPAAHQVTVTVFNVLGQRIATLVDQVMPAGVHSVLWDGTGPDGAEAASGVYFYRVEAGAFVDSRKMLLVK